MSFFVVKDHSSWLIVNGENINLWVDNYCGKKLIDIVQLPSNLQRDLKAKLSDFILDQSLCTPPYLLSACPLLQQLIPKVLINPLHDDKFIWNDTDNGLLTVKDAYTHLGANHQSLSWGKIILNSSIPPLKSLFLPSQCNLCLRDSESLQHLFFDCSFANCLWR